MKFEDLYSLFKRYQINDVELLALHSLRHKVKSDKTKIDVLTKEQLDIEFKLLLPYKIFDLIIEANKESVHIESEYEDEHYYRNLVITLRYDRYNEFVLVVNENTTAYDYECAVDVIKYAREQRLEQEHKDKVRSEALNKLTTEEKEVLGLS